MGDLVNYEFCHQDYGNNLKNNTNIGSQNMLKVIGKLRPNMIQEGRIVILDELGL